MTYIPPLDDMRFVLENVVDLAGLSKLDVYRHADPDTVYGLLDEAGRFFAQVLGPLNRVGDQHPVEWHPDHTVTTPPGFADAYRQYVEAGWGAVPFDPAYGGGGFPWLVAICLQEMLTAANKSFSMAPLLTQGAIDLIASHGSEEQQAVYLPKMITGEWTGTMNLTEADAGSDVGALRTKAVRQDDGTYRITGQKIFITFGEHDMAEQIVHLVLARTPDAPPGTKGISCFIVPKFLVNDDGSLGARNDVRCVSIEHKMGIHASPTCVLSYGDEGGAVGYLIGEENRGMRYMFTMMNNARLSVGLEGLAIGEAAYQQAVAYAHERRQGRAPGAPAGESSPIVAHPDVRRMLLTMKAFVEAMRAIVYLNAESIDLAKHAPDEDERVARQELADLLTPITKAWCTDTGCEVASLNIQVHGGMGYVEESGAPQLYRDLRIASIYEGTNGIQAMDLVGRKLPMRGGGVMEDLIASMRRLDPDLAAGGEELASIRANLTHGVDVLDRATQWLLTNGFADQNAALAAATPYVHLCGYVVGAWLLARQALAASRRLAAGDGNAAYLRERVLVARFFAEQLLPRADSLLAAVTAGPADLLAFDPAPRSGV